MNKAINSNYVMNQDEINELKNEFNKDKNIIGKMPDIGELLRAEIIKEGKSTIILIFKDFLTQIEDS